MDVNKINSVSFGNIYQGKVLTHRLANKLFSVEKQGEYSKIMDYISKNKLDKKRFIDIKFDIDENDKFYAVMWPKKEDVPMHPDTVHRINFSKNGLSAFKKWVISWNSDYNPKSFKYDSEAAQKFIKGLIVSNSDNVKKLNIILNKRYPNAN